VPTHQDEMFDDSNLLDVDDCERSVIELVDLPMGVFDVSTDIQPQAEDDNYTPQQKEEQVFHIQNIKVKHYLATIIRLALLNPRMTARLMGTLQMLTIVKAQKMQIL
jgi:hypothetical protein